MFYVSESKNRNNDVDSLWILIADAKSNMEY